MLTRRRFLQSSVLTGAALVVGFRLDSRPAAAAEARFAPNAFVRITPDNVVTIISKHLEMGQGTYTGLATILAEELDADWSQVRVEAAPVDLLGKYANLAPNFRVVVPVLQATGGSTSIANSWEQLRWAGARARAMLVAAAAREWGVGAAEVVVDRGIVSHRRGQRATFGELVPKTAGIAEPPAASVRLKDPHDFKLVGKDVPRVDRASKTDGSATFTMDFTLPGMLTALIARAPRFGATVKNFDATAARRVKGVTHVEEVPSGVAVVATGFWAARKGREALKVRWNEEDAETSSSDRLYEEYEQFARSPGTSARRVGDAKSALAKATTSIERVYKFPYLAHAPMEPLAAVARIGRDGCDVWTGSQFPTLDRVAAARAAGMLPLGLHRVRVHTLMAGGSFGRRATPDGDIVADAVAVARAIKDPRPVKVVWTREDDIQGGRYRPLYVHRLRAGLDGRGDIVGWEHHVVGQSISSQSKLTAGKIVTNRGVDPLSVEGAAELPYAVPHVSVELHPTDKRVHVPVLWWRSVGHTHNAFVTETLLDECLIAARRDPVQGRLDLLKGKPRHHATLTLAAKMAGWDAKAGWKDLPAGRARGVAVHESFRTVVAQIAEVSLRPDGLPKVERVVCAVDCGRVINPDVVKAQMEGGIGFGLGAALWSEITIDAGRPQQSNFDDYRPLRMEDMPVVEVYHVESDAAPTGVGEPGVPPIAPAVANALAMLTGRRTEQLPFARLTPAGIRTV